MSDLRQRLGSSVSLDPRRDDHVVSAFVLVSLLLTRVIPGFTPTLTEVVVVAVIVLSYDVALRRLGSPVLIQPGVLALAAWVTGVVLGWNTSPVIALVVALSAGVLAALTLLALPVSVGPAGLVMGGLALTMVLTDVVPPVPGFAPPVFLGIDLGTPTAALMSALLALALGAWAWRLLLMQDLGRWLVAAKHAPKLVARGGVSPRAVTAAGLALAGGLAGLAGWAAAIATLGGPVTRAVDPSLALSWVAATLVIGPGTAGVLGGAGVFVLLSKLAVAVELSPLLLLGPLTAGLLWRQAGGLRGIRS